ncbi:MAG: hypothetical protein U9R48_00895 [Chloroflexota bacterium]|nr:hypothetical protein [Chloroflexota bacterium]
MRSNGFDDGTAVAGHCANLGTTAGTPPTGSDVTDNDPSHYFGTSNRHYCYLPLVFRPSDGLPASLYMQKVSP